MPVIDGGVAARFQPFLLLRIASLAGVQAVGAIPLMSERVTTGFFQAMSLPT